MASQLDSIQAISTLHRRKSRDQVVLLFMQIVFHSENAQSVNSLSALGIGCITVLSALPGWHILGFEGGSVHYSMTFLSLTMCYKFTGSRDEVT